MAAFTSRNGVWAFLAIVLLLGLVAYWLERDMAAHNTLPATPRRAGPRPLPSE